MESSIYVYDKASLDKEWTRSLCEAARDNNVAFITTPYSIDLVDYVEPFLDAIKIGSGDITYHSIIKKIVEKNKPILLAAGASNLTEVQMAMRLLNKVR